MSITQRPAGDQRCLLIANVVAIRVFQIDGFSPVLHNRSASHDYDGRGNTQPFRKHSELVCSSVVVRVFANTNTITVTAQLVRIVDRFTNPQTATLVPIHGDGLAKGAGPRRGIERRVIAEP